MWIGTTGITVQQREKPFYSGMKLQARKTLTLKQIYAKGEKSVTNHFSFKLRFSSQQSHKMSLTGNKSTESSFRLADAVNSITPQEPMMIWL